MTINTVDDSQRKAARVAGFAYLLSFATVVFAQFGIHHHLIVVGNAAETARSIIANERSFRTYIAFNLVYSADALRLPVVQVPLYPRSTGRLGGDLVPMARGVHLRLSHFSRPHQSHQSVVVRFAHGSFRDGQQLLASGQGVEAVRES